MKTEAKLTTSKHITLVTVGTRGHWQINALNYRLNKFYINISRNPNPGLSIPLRIPFHAFPLIPYSMATIAPTTTAPATPWAALRPAAPVAIAGPVG